MKGKFEEKLAQLAFGDLKPDEAAKLEQEAQANPEAMRTLALYKDMRAGLRSLSDIPEDQFSKERLRDAILTQGLRPVPTRPVSNRAWLWMPAAACVLGFALMYGNNTFRKPSAGPNIVLGEKSLKFGPPTSDLIDFTPQPVATNVTTHGIAKAPEKDLKPLVARADPDEVSPNILASMNDDAYDPDLGKMPANAPAVTSNTLAENNPADRKSSATTVPIVLIDQDTDQQTGACKATEVGSSSNVLVGG